MNDIEKLFKDKLQHHPVTPPAEVWETLQSSLQQQQRKKRAGWWWMAASITLLATVGAFFYLNNQPTVLPKGSEIANNPAAVQPVEPIQSQSPSAEFQDDSTAPIATIRPQPLSAKAATPVSSVSMPSTYVVKKVERMQPITRLELNSLEETTLKSKPMLLQNSLVAVAQTPDEDTPTVTIIYKSGGGEVKEENTNKNPLAKAANFLASIKENGVGFSELRSAKSEIISKAFSGNREPMPAE